MPNIVTRPAIAAALLLAAPAVAQQAPAKVSPEQVQQLIDTLKQRNDQVRALSDKVRELEARAARADGIVAKMEAAEKALVVASQKNQALVAIGEEIIVKYETMSLGKRVLSGEPYTQLYRVKMQNELQDYRDKIAQLGFYPEKEMQPAPAAPAVQPSGN